MKLYICLNSLFYPLFQKYQNLKMAKFSIRELGYTCWFAKFKTREKSVFTKSRESRNLIPLKSNAFKVYYFILLRYFILFHLTFILGSRGRVRQKTLRKKCLCRYAAIKRAYPASRQDHVSRYPVKKKPCSSQDPVIKKGCVELFAETFSVKEKSNMRDKYLSFFILTLFQLTWIFFL